MYGYGLSYTGTNNWYAEEFEPEEFYWWRLWWWQYSKEEIFSILRTEPPITK